MKITSIHAREIYDSRGWPTIECSIGLTDDMYVLASVPAGLSTGSYEAKQLRDGGQRLMGLGVRTAVRNIEEVIAPALLGQTPSLVDCDMQMMELDGTANKERLGANAMLAVSTAIAKAQALAYDIELFELYAHALQYDVVTMPLPMLNLINGGVHADNGMCIQEIMLLPFGFPSFSDAFQASVELFYTLKKVMKEGGKRVLFGAEGGLSPVFGTISEPFDYIIAALEQQGMQDHFRIAIDVAASQLYDHGTQKYNWYGTQLNAQELIEVYAGLIEHYPIFSVEDGLSEHDTHGWTLMMEKLGDKVQIVGDDLLATSPDRIARGVENGWMNAAIIKPNQIGTLTQTLQSIQVCQRYGVHAVVSHRSGETDDTAIADLAVGSNVALFKGGGCTGLASISKYNRLLEIESYLADMITML